MERLALSPHWTIGILRTAPGILPSWLARLGPTFVPVPSTSVRPRSAAPTVASVTTPHGEAPLVASDGTALHDLERLERAIVTEQAFDYRPQALPTWVPHGARRVLARVEHTVRRSLADGSRLSYSLGADAVTALLAHTRGERVSHPWPDGRSAALVVTHDIEGTRPHPATVARTRTLAEGEAALGIRGTYFLVPALWRGTSLPDELRALGHEVACHGIDHTGREAYASPRSLREAAGSLGDGVRGYRSPRFGCASGHGDKIAAVFEYDSSRPETRWRLGEPAWAGCGTVFPFLETERLVQLPLTLPTEIELLDDGMTWAQVAVAWRAKWRLIRDAGGLGTLCTHVPAPGGVDGVLDFLRHVVADPGTWVGSAGDLVSFLRESPVVRPGTLRPWREFAKRPARRRPTQLPVVAVS